MTIKEITALRKAGHLDEALQAAENEFAQAENKYTAAALFWCLYDLSKQQEREDIMLPRVRLYKSSNPPLPSQCLTSRMLLKSNLELTYPDALLITILKRCFKPILWIEQDIFFIYRIQKVSHTLP